MQPFTGALARTYLKPQPQSITVGESAYRVVLDGGRGRLVERGPEGERWHEIVYALGGKNVYYFLTPMERGRLQILPVAFDVREGRWFDTAASAVRHFQEMTDEPLDWREWAYTFNTACYGCHVSQIEPNYDLETDTYRTTWTEPGINCETCHGPAAEHVRACRAVGEGERPEDLRIIRTKEFDVTQINNLCASCHAKGSPLSVDFVPGGRFFDHFDLVTLEDPDYYPDGRDLGENYTQTSWLLSPCAASGTLDCLHCHTSSGRYRHGGDPDHSCLPCHQEHVQHPEQHTHHKEESSGSRCISCHMPETSFARMRRHDHSMRSPTPAATIAFESPNACNLCHRDQDAQWSERWVRKWYGKDYQAPILHTAALIEAARQRDWSRLQEMLEYLGSDERHEIFANSLISLLRSCDDDRKWPALIRALEDLSPLVRGSAAEALGDRLTPESIAALVRASADEYRLVRIRVAAALAAVPAGMYTPRQRETVQRAVAEFEAAMRGRPDDPFSHYNLGNFHLARRELAKAVASFETAIRLRPEFVPPLVNAALAYSLQERYDRAETSLRQALEIEPGSAAASFNLGLLLGEQGRRRDAIEALRAALAVDPELAAAAYNLGVLLAETDIDDAIHWCRRAEQLRPREPKYTYTLAFYEHQKGDHEAAIASLKRLIERHPGYADAYRLLGAIHEARGKSSEAFAVYREASETEELTEQDRREFSARMLALSVPPPSAE
jgi:tetratricopeptide (TPR) repeat protein